ncbi:uncharacterized protein [Nicotiana sylvestris]|uniref:uncharacterized protein n=1 Tax=Nicotiana sylvestris TaxID=4096 RepID=UPI00388CDAC4
MAEDCELCDIICDSPYVPTKVLEEFPFSMAKTSNEYTEADKKAVEENFRAKKILVCGIGREEYNRISTCDTAKEIRELCKQRMRSRLVRKILSFLPSSWESKVNDITKSKDLQELTIEELIGNLKTYELKRKIDSARREPNKEKNLRHGLLKQKISEDGQKKWRNAKKGQLKQSKNRDLCYKCGKPGHFMKDCPLLKEEFSQNYHKKTAKTNLVPFKDFKRKRSADNMIRHALATWRDSSTEFEDEPDIGDSSMMAVEGEEIGYDLTFALMAQLDDDEDNDNKKVTFRDVQRNLKSYSPKKLMFLVKVFITVFHSLVEDRDSLTLELGEFEQTKDDLVVVVTDHKKTIEILRKEKDDLLAKIIDLRETIVKPWTKSKPENFGKGNEIASEEHIRLENEVKAIRSRMCAEIKKNEQLQTDLERVNNDLEKSLKWTWSSEVTIALHTNDCENRKGIGSQRHFKEDVQAKNQSIQKNKVFAEKGTVKGSGQQWFMDSGFSKHMTGNTTDFLALKALQGGSILCLLCVSQICDKGNKVEFLSKICTVTDLVTGEIILVAKRYKNIYVADFEYLQSGDLRCLKVVDDDAKLWNRRLGHASFSLLNKLIQNDLVHGLPMSQFKMQKSVMLVLEENM